MIEKVKATLSIVFEIFIWTLTFAVTGVAFIFISLFRYYGILCLVAAIGFYTPVRTYSKERKAEFEMRRYVYVSITCKDGKNRNRRLHVLLGKTFLFNPNPKKYKIVGHKDNDKTHYELSNLYWTDNQENVQKAFDDGLIINKKAEHNKLSKYVKVIDKVTYEIVGVYGSLRECERCIDNITLSSISKAYKKDYVPRTRKYIYKESSKEEFDSYPNLQNIHLIENLPNNKKPKVFRMSNKKMKYSEIFDNQVVASEISGIPQAEISHILNDDVTLYNGWEFELLDETDRINTSAYQNHLDTVDRYTIKNINDGRILEFNSGKDLLDYFNLKGHHIKAYINKDHILMSEWVIISINNKSDVQRKIS
ncbi:hypothetical protein [Coprococcus catus]|uniref:hypothetical protein n=1 Tax=Coprococcus catus TaxID=116085 RepID=UPI003D07FAB1